MSFTDTSRQFTLGVDIGGTNTKYGLINRRGEILAKGNLSTAGHTTPEGFVAALHAEVAPVIEENGGFELLIGIGIGAPNANYYTGTIEHAANLPWTGIVPFAELITATFGIEALSSVHPGKFAITALEAADALIAELK